MSDGPLVVFKSVQDFFTIERNGNKPNTVRLLTEDEYTSRLDCARAALLAGEPATILIVNRDVPDQSFFRRLTSIEQVGALVGQFLWVLSWRHEDGDGTYDDRDALGKEEE